MLLLPSNLREKLEFDKIKELLTQYALGELGKDALSKLNPIFQYDLLECKLLETYEYKVSITENMRFPMYNYQDIKPYLKELAIIDFVLSIEGLQAIHKILIGIRDIFSFFNHEKQEKFPNLYSIVRSLTLDVGLIQAIDNVIDEEGNIRPNASPALLAIHKGILSKKRELDKAFAKQIEKYRNNGWLSDNIESFRNGRRVLAVPSEHKRKIRGIIHDESATGKTTFIEPEAIININNDIFDLEMDYRKEIYRLLKELSSTLRAYIPLLGTYQETIIRFDIIQAKARLAVAMDASLPKMTNTPQIDIKQGFHPLLKLKNKKLAKPTIPFDLFLLKNKILVVSGPNAGGKSITMKAVGLLQLMFQAGLLLPVDENSTFGIFKKICADIGDQQSIEDDLSTYSSRLQNMRNFLDTADENTLLLIDEFGSGTDPKIGGAIAEALLKEFYKKDVFAVITTHYSNLKVFAFKNKGILNAAMVFDRDSLSPTYEMQVGKPGSSYAYEIAQKSGLNKKILDYARHKTGKNEKAVDELLVNLQHEKKQAEEEKLSLQAKQEKLNKLIESYEAMQKDLTYNRKKHKLNVREWEMQQNLKLNKELENLIRELKEERNLEKAKKVAAQQKEKRQQLAENVKQIHEDIYHNKSTQPKRPIEVGDFVKLKTGGSTGIVEALDKKKAIIAVGQIRMSVKLRDLQHAKETLELNPQKSVQSDLKSKANFIQNLDIRGMRRDEALRMIETFVDAGLVAGSNQLKILHGKGNGVLRKAVLDKLKEYQQNIEKIYHPEREQGGDGITMIVFG